MTPIFWSFTFLVVLAPLPFGMVHELVQALFAFLMIGLAGGLNLYQMITGSANPVPLRKIVWETTGFMVVISWALLQMLPITPVSLHHPLWTEAGRALGRDIAGAISVSPGAGFQSLMRIVSYGFVFWLALQLFRDRKRGRVFIDMFILAGTLYAVYGMLIEIEGIRKVLWAGRYGPAGVVTGTFVNRNTFATYAGIALLCAVGSYLSGLVDLVRKRRRGIDRLVTLTHAALVQGAPRLASIFILLTALLMTTSRGGIVASLTALALLLVLFFTVQSAHRRLFGLAVGALMIALIITIFTAGNKFTLRMGATDLGKEYRIKAYEQIWQAIRGAPLTGFGLGCFSRAFPLYADIRTSHWDKAHNDWLEMIFELGWPAALLWFGILISLALRCLVGFFRRMRDNIYPLLGFCVALLVGLHAFVDFSLQVPAVAVSFAAILGVGVSQSFSSRI